MEPPQDSLYSAMERAARAENSPEANTVKIAALNLAGKTETLYSVCKELQGPSYYLSTLMKNAPEQFMNTYMEQ